MTAPQSLASLADLSLVDPPSPFFSEVLTAVAQRKRLEDVQEVVTGLEEMIQCHGDQWEKVTELTERNFSHHASLEELHAGSKLAGPFVVCISLTDPLSCAKQQKRKRRELRR